MIRESIAFGLSVLAVATTATASESEVHAPVLYAVDFGVEEADPPLFQSGNIPVMQDEFLNAKLAVETLNKFQQVLQQPAMSQALIGAQVDLIELTDDPSWLGHDNKQRLVLNLNIGTSAQELETAIGKMLKNKESAEAAVAKLMKSDVRRKLKFLYVDYEEVVSQLHEMTLKVLNKDAGIWLKEHSTPVPVWFGQGFGTDGRSIVVDVVKKRKQDQRELKIVLKYLTMYLPTEELPQ